MIIGCVGDVGSGKTLLLVQQCIAALDAGKEVFTNVKITYKAANGKQAHVVDFGKLANWFTRGKIKFPPNSALLAMDEAYMGLDARAGNNPFTRLISYFIFQSRKFGFDIFFNVQLASSLEKRLRNLAQKWIVAESRWEENSMSHEMEQNFYYSILSREYGLEELMINYEDALKIFPWYKTTQIVKAPKASIDKKLAKKYVEDFERAQLEEAMGEPIPDEREVQELTGVNQNADIGDLDEVPEKQKKTRKKKRTIIEESVEQSPEVQYSQEMHESGVDPTLSEGKKEEKKE